MSKIDLSKLNQSDTKKLQTMTRGRDYSGPISGSCKYPTQMISIDHDTDINLCHCDAWLPIPVGKVLDFNSIEEVFNSPIALELQKDVADKKFTYCAVTHCGVIDRHMSFNKTQLSINIDNSCNLACPSCRRESIMITDGEIYDLKVKSMDRILSWLEKYQDPIHITMSGNGDCLASYIMRNLIKTYQPRPNQTFTIFTNGLLMEKILPTAPLLSAVTQYKISIDAGSAEVYEVVRRPGKWSVLIDNLDWLKENKKSASVRLLYVVQNKNYKDLFNFANLCRTYGFRGIISQLDDWATWSRPTLNKDGVDYFTIENGTYLENNVLNPANKNHQDCLRILKEISKTHSDIISLNPLVKTLL